jgi:two-component system, cell cycle sensor histidine kinase and response regulator CckA
LMSFSRKKPVVEKVIDTKLVLAELDRMLRRLIAANIEMTVATEEGLWNVLGDQAQIEQVLVNLVVNASDAMPKGGKIEISAKNALVKQGEDPAVPPGEYVRLAVADNGTGISPQDLDHIFEPFFTTKDIGKGTGLGLATVAGIMKRLDGAIKVDTVPGRGTTFTVYIPREASTATVIPTVHLRISRGHETVLVVEDEAQVRVMLERTLYSLGYDVISASCGEEALDAAAGREINLVISDVVMPGMTVQDLIGNLRKRHRYVRVLLISGHMDEAIADLLIKDIQIISKPFSTEVLSAKVREILDSREYK